MASIPAVSQKTQNQAQLFANRLSKRYKHVSKWARRTGVTCFRLYDRDIPEIPLCLDIYESTDHVLYAVLFLYERPYEKAEEEELEWLECMKNTVNTVLGIQSENIFTKLRRRQRSQQYEKLGEKELFIKVCEHGSVFLVNLSSYVDTGLFFDHRPLRAIIRSKSDGKSVLNLFCYTGSFSVHATSGGALSVHSVDLSKNYLEWADKNLTLNGFNDIKRYPCIAADVFTFLKKTQNTWDIIILDPPTFSNSKKTDTVLDINKDWLELVQLCLTRLSNGGTLYFSSNSRSLKFDASQLPKKVSTVKDISLQTIPDDFRNTHIHQCWEIIKEK